MGSLIEKHKSEEMKLISAIVAAATAQQMVQTDYWNGVDESNTCGSTWEWQDADGNGISVVNATCTWTSNSVTGLPSGSSGSAALRFFFAQTCVNGTCDNSTCWDVTPDCQANPNNEALPGLYIQENVNDPRGNQDSWNLQVAGV